MYEGPPVSRQRLRAMMKHLAKKKHSKITAVFQCSIPQLDNERVYKGRIVEWNVKTLCNDGQVPLEYQVYAKFANGLEMDEYVPADAWFNGLCNVTWNNSGPYCRFYGEWA